MPQEYTRLGSWRRPDSFSLKYHARSFLPIKVGISGLRESNGKSLIANHAPIALDKRILSLMKKGARAIKKFALARTLFGRRRCVDITRNVAAVAPERSSLAYGPVVPEEHNSSRSITPRAIISSFQRGSPEVFLPPFPPSLPRSFLSPPPRRLLRCHATAGASSFRRRTHTPRVSRRYAYVRTCT